MTVSQVIVNQLPTAVLTLGDNCHEPTATCYADYYDPSWGRFKSITHPVSGNHDYMTANASHYYDYFNGAGSFSGPAGDRDKGYYSFDIGEWHIIALNTQCSEVGGCSSGSPQYAWLENDLMTHEARCTLAFYHIPLFSSGGRANSNARGFFTLLYNYNAEIVLNGHDHIYERFAPQKYDGTLDNTRGIRQFTVGTGGANHTSIEAVQPNSEVRNVDTFGVIKLTLHPDRYDWQFVPVAGETFADSGTTYCH
jgi:3',5'-cyclic AMP phosphodiesterase CpdA